MDKVYVFTYRTTQLVFCGQSSEASCWHMVKRDHPDWMVAEIEVEVISQPVVFEMEVEEV